MTTYSDAVTALAPEMYVRLGDEPSGEHRHSFAVTGSFAAADGSGRTVQVSACECGFTQYDLAEVEA